MEEMRELVTVEQADRVIVIIAIALLALGLLLGVIVGAIRRRLATGAAAGVLLGAAGPALWLLWGMYNGIIGRYGLDSVRGLLINLALFVSIGLLVGLMVGLAWRRQARRNTAGSAAQTPEPTNRG